MNYLIEQLSVIVMIHLYQSVSPVQPKSVGNEKFCVVWIKCQWLILMNLSKTFILCVKYFFL